MKPKSRPYLLLFAALLFSALACVSGNGESTGAPSLAPTRRPGEIRAFSLPSGESVTMVWVPAGASPYGALDMGGNVWEWVADWYGEDYYSSPEANENPAGPSSGRFREVRGGSWLNDEWNIRASNRIYDFPGRKNISFGFRCVAIGVAPGG